MRTIKKILKIPIRMLLKLSARKQLSRLSTIRNPAADKIVNALTDTLNDHLASEEKTWVDRIEALRKKLSRSSTEISITDYGVGAANLKRTKEAMYQGVTVTRTVGNASRASTPYFWSLLLFKLVRNFRPSSCLELGTCVGISGAYQASAQQLNKNGGFVTLEGDKSLGSLAVQNLQSLGLDNISVVTGRFHVTLDKVLNEHKPIDYVFIDGHHDEDATIAYFEQIQPYFSEKSILIVDDISWSDGMRKAWKRIEGSEKVRISLDLRVIGICILDNDIDQKYSFRIWLV
ncbi:MAG: class I SAM-dependent methyltransferase [Deltaproteobacteria bacterium]|nr:class I SAM-dependent methyltransferase [Deltaproteobacteria bacterium]